MSAFQWPAVLRGDARISLYEKLGLEMLRNVFLLLLCVNVSVGMCPYIDAYWKVNYHRGLVKYDPENLPDPPTVSQVGHGDLEVRWGHLIYDQQCVDR